MASSFLIVALVAAILQAGEHLSCPEPCSLFSWIVLVAVVTALCAIAVALLVPRKVGPP